VAQTMGPQSEWVRLQRTVFGIESEKGTSPNTR
jgi:hypothetical protein